MLSFSQTKLAEGLGITFQQVQKYENGTNRISSSRMQQSCECSSGDTRFFFEGYQAHPQRASYGLTPEYFPNCSPPEKASAYVKAFMQIKSPKLKRAIVAQQCFHARTI